MAWARAVPRIAQDGLSLAAYVAALDRASGRLPGGLAATATLRFDRDSRCRWVLHRLWIAVGNEALAYAGRTSGEQVVAGIAGVFAGVVLVAWPGPSLLVLAFFVGGWLAVSGSFY